MRVQEAEMAALVAVRPGTGVEGRPAGRSGRPVG